MSAIVWCYISYNLMPPSVNFLRDWIVACYGWIAWLIKASYLSVQVLLMALVWKLISHVNGVYLCYQKCSAVIILAVILLMASVLVWFKFVCYCMHGALSFAHLYSRYRHGMSFWKLMVFSFTCDWFYSSSALPNVREEFTLGQTSRTDSKTPRKLYLQEFEQRNMRLEKKMRSKTVPTSIWLRSPLRNTSTSAASLKQETRWLYVECLMVSRHTPQCAWCFRPCTILFCSFCDVRKCSPAIDAQEQKQIADIQHQQSQPQVGSKALQQIWFACHIGISRLVLTALVQETSSPDPPSPPSSPLLLFSLRGACKASFSPSSPSSSSFSPQLSWACSAFSTSAACFLLFCSPDFHLESTQLHPHTPLGLAGSNRHIGSWVLFFVLLPCTRENVLHHILLALNRLWQFKFRCGPSIPSSHW